MSKILTEQEVLKKLGISDFRHITKGKVIYLVSMLDKMDPEVAKKAIEQFPDFARTMKEILLEYLNAVGKMMESNDKSVQAVYNQCKLVNEALSKMLEDDLTFEQKQWVIGQMKEIIDKTDEMDSKNKKFLYSCLCAAGAVVLGVGALLMTVLGGKARIKGDDNSEEDNPDVDSIGFDPIDVDPTGFDPTGFDPIGFDPIDVDFSNF